MLGAIKPARETPEIPHSKPPESSASAFENAEELGKGEKPAKARQQTQVPLFSVAEWMRQNAASTFAGMIHSHRLDLNRVTLVHTSPTMSRLTDAMLPLEFWERFKIPEVTQVLYATFLSPLPPQLTGSPAVRVSEVVIDHDAHFLALPGARDLVLFARPIKTAIDVALSCILQHATTHPGRRYHGHSSCSVTDRCFVVADTASH